MATFKPLAPYGSAKYLQLATKVGVPPKAPQQQNKTVN